MSPDGAVPSAKPVSEAPAQPNVYANRCTLDRYGVDAAFYMRTAVKLQLNDPGSARFPNVLDGVSVDPSACTFTVRGEFSAKNGFDGRVRGFYDVTLRRSEDGDWSLISADVVG